MLLAEVLDLLPDPCHLIIRETTFGEALHSVLSLGLVLFEAVIVAAVHRMRELGRLRLLLLGRRLGPLPGLGRHCGGGWEVLVGGRLVEERRLGLLARRLAPGHRSCLLLQGAVISILRRIVCVVLGVSHGHVCRPRRTVAVDMLLPSLPRHVLDLLGISRFFAVRTRLARPRLTPPAQMSNRGGALRIRLGRRLFFHRGSQLSRAGLGVLVQECSGIVVFDSFLNSLRDALRLALLALAGFAVGRLALPLAMLR